MKYLFLAFLLSVSTVAYSQSSPEEIPFTYVEKMPSFPGGDALMYKYVYTHIKYPPEAMANQISGVVIVQFVVSTQGELKDFKVARSLGYGCDEEAVRVLSSMNEGHRWEPGKHYGRVVPVIYTLPVKFSLK